MLLNNINEIFRTSLMKERLFKMIKENGDFIRLDRKLGYVYQLEFCGSAGCICIEVAYKDAKNISILNATIRQSSKVTVAQ
ncbi:hypothetical protein ACFFIX_19425 [Metabacillus herbersteinensis]|uniref:Uncharacterized protein n=1 Tax=Metabacillus herbersteinensis TaxID=283816 RepID=A0ABV6GJ76_9BACI